MNLFTATRRDNGFGLAPFNSLLNLDRLLSAPFEAVVRDTAEWVDAPLLDLHENENNYVVKLEIPGVDRKDIKLEINDGVLTISGERKAEKVTDGTEVHRQERFYGRFERRLQVPKPITQA